MLNAAGAGVVYFFTVFAIGFVLGTIRVLALVPRLGETVTVLVESPIILAASWFVCAFLIRRRKVAAIVPARIVMGAWALALLLLAEFLLAYFFFARSFDDQLESYATPAGAIGLAGQILFAAFPLIQLWLQKKN